MRPYDLCPCVHGTRGSICRQRWVASAHGERGASACSVRVHVALRAHRPASAHSRACVFSVWCAGRQAHTMCRCTMCKGQRAHVAGRNSWECLIRALAQLDSVSEDPALSSCPAVLAGRAWGGRREFHRFLKKLEKQSSWFPVLPVGYCSPTHWHTTASW